MKRLLLMSTLFAFGASEAAAQIPVGSKAPEIEAKAWFNNPAGQTLKELRGRVVFIEMWATW